MDLYKKHITNVDRNPLCLMIAFHNKRMFKFGDVIEVN